MVLLNNRKQLIFIVQFFVFQPSPPIPSKSAKNVLESTEDPASQLLKSKSPVSSPRPVSPMTPPSESPHHTAKISRSASPSLVLVTEKDVFGLQQSPILHRRLQEGGLNQMMSEPGYLKSNENVGEIETSAKDSVKDEDASNAVTISSAHVLKTQPKPPPPKPKTKLKTGQSSAMLVKNTAEQSKPDVAKEEEKQRVRATPRWLNELQKKKAKCSGDASNQNKVGGMTANRNQMPSDVTSLSKDESVKREEPLTKVESPTDELPAWMKLEFSKMKKGPDKTETEDSSALEDKGQESRIDHLLRKPKPNEPSKPNWLDQLNKRRKQLWGDDGHDDKLKENDTSLTVNEHFDYRSHEELKQKDHENVVDEDETDGVMKSVFDIKRKLNKNNISNEDQYTLKKTAPLKSLDDDERVGGQHHSMGHKEVTHIFGKEVPAESSEKNKELVGKHEQNVGHFEHRANENELKSFSVESCSMMDKVRSNADAKVDNICNDTKKNTVPRNAPLDDNIVKGIENRVDGGQDESVWNKWSSEGETELAVEKPGYSEEKPEPSYLENSLCENSGSTDIQQDAIKNSKEIHGNVLPTDLNSKDMKDGNISCEFRSNSYLNSSSNGRDAAKVEDAIEKDILKKCSEIQVGKSGDARVDPILGEGHRGEDKGKIETAYSSVTRKDVCDNFDEKADKSSLDRKVVQNLETMGEFKNNDNILNLASGNFVDSSAASTRPEQHLRSERGKYDEKEEEGKRFPKPLRRKLVHIDSFEQGISKPTYNDGQKQTVNENMEKKSLYVKQESTVNVEKAIAVENKVEDRNEGGGDKNSSDDIDVGKEVSPTNGDGNLSFKAEVGKNHDKDVHISDTKLESDISLSKAEACQGEGVVLGSSDGTDSERNNLKKAIFELKKEHYMVQKDEDSSNLREKTKPLTAISGVDKGMATNEQKPYDVHKDTSGDRMDSDKKKDASELTKDSFLLGKEQEPASSVKRPPAPKPKPKPKPKQRPPLRNALEIKDSPQQEESKKATFIRPDSHETKIGPNKVQVTQIENLKNIEKSKNSQEQGSEKEQSSERTNEKHSKTPEKVKVEMRRKDENSRKQNRPVSMFENFSSADSNLPMRERKFSGISSGTKFAMELERKQKSCWFRGALDTNDIKSIDEYDGDDDIPAWKRQLLARLKSNESSSGNNFFPICCKN